MTRSLDAIREERQRRRDVALLLLLEGGLVEAVAGAGAELLGFGVSLRGGDCLITVKVILAGRRQIAFVGAEDLPSALLKVAREAKLDSLRWRADKYGEGVNSTKEPRAL